MSTADLNRSQNSRQHILSPPAHPWEVPRRGVGRPSREAMGWDPKGAAPNPQTQGTWESHLGENKEPRDRKRDGNTRPVKRNGPKRMKREAK